MTETRRGRGRPARLLNEDDVLDAAVGVLATGDAASMQDIADRSGVAKTTLHDRYGGKVALVERAISRERRRLADHLVAAYNAGRGDSRPGAQVRNGYAAFFNYAREYPASFRVLFGGSPPRESPVVHESRATVADTIAEIVAERFAAAGLPLGPSRDVIAAVIVGAGEAVARVVAEDDGVDLGAVTDLVSDLITNGLSGVNVDLLAGFDGPRPGHGRRRPHTR